MLFLPFPFLYYLQFFSLSSPHFLCFLFCPSCTTEDISPPVPLYHGFVLRDHFPSKFQCCWNVHCSHLLPPLVFPHHSVCSIMFLGLLALHMVILSWSSTWLQHLPLLLFILLIITICRTCFYLFVLFSSLLFTSSLTCPCLLLNYWVRCILALHVVFLQCNSTRLQLLPSYCFVLD